MYPVKIAADKQLGQDGMMGIFHGDEARDKTVVSCQLSYFLRVTLRRG
jgi:hypothetical protein